MIPDPIRCSFNFPGHVPHGGRVVNFLRKGVEASGEVAGAVEVNRTTVRLMLFGGAEHTYRHHQPGRIAAAFEERRGPVKLYVADGLLTIPVGTSELFFSVAGGTFRTCREHAAQIAEIRRVSQGLTERNALVAYRLRGPFIPEDESRTRSAPRRPRRRPDGTGGSSLLE